MRAPLEGMLRITVPSSSNGGVFIVQGRLTGLWAKELLRLTRTKNQGYGHTFDFQKVIIVDSSGEKILRLLAERGARFITDSAYGKDLCNRLRLHRVTPSEMARTEKTLGTSPGSEPWMPMGSILHRRGCQPASVELRGLRRTKRGER